MTETAAPISSPSAANARQSPVTHMCFGARGPTTQLARIEAGLIAAGSQETNSGHPSFVYANDESHWQAAIDYHDLICPEAKLILNVLDLPEHNAGFDSSSLLPRLARAHAVTSISYYVQSQVQRILNLYSHVIYNPVMPVNPNKRLMGERPYPQFRAMMVGRVRDPGKRGVLAVQAMILAGMEESEVAVVGSEPIGWGTYLGIVSESVLNDLYNSVDFVMVTSGFEGLGLPIVESMIAGAIPIVCHDLTTFPELCPPRWGCYPNPQSVAHRLRRLIDEPALLAEDREYALKRGEGFREQLSGRAVAGRILEAHQWSKHEPTSVTL